MLRSPPKRTASSSLHSASVHITGFADLVNPNPWIFELPERKEREKDDPSCDYLSPKKLVELTGERNLHKLNYLEFSINTKENSLGNFGKYIFAPQCMHGALCLFHIHFIAASEQALGVAKIRD